jgi:hypothetical protein
MLLEHAHKPENSAPGYCQDCARETELLDHDWHVQREERALTEAHRWARHHAICALWSAGIGILLATIALFHGPDPCLEVIHDGATGAL